MTLAVERDLGELRLGLERWLGRPVADVRRPAPGWSCETLIVDDDLVVRLPPAGDGIFPVYDLAQQAAVQQAMHDAGIPVASPVRYEPDPQWLGAPFVTMPFVAGPIPGEFTPADPWLGDLPDDDARAGVWRSFLDTVTAIHRVDAAALGLRTGLARELDWWDDYVDWATDGHPPPALAEVLAWCRDRRPDDEPPPSTLWGDVRLGNVVFGDDGSAPAAVLDWDMVSAGPAEMDLAWFLALEAVQTDLTGMQVSGFGTRAEVIARAEKDHGRPFVEMGWFEIFALARASAVSTRIALLFERAGQRSMFRVGEDPTLAAAARRISAR